MKVAICGYPPLAMQVQDALQNSGIEFKFFIEDFVSARGGGVYTNLPLINFFDFRRLVNVGELDGVIVVEEHKSSFTKAVVQVCKFYGIPKVGVMNLNSVNPLNIRWLELEKAYFVQVEVNIVDGCNLNCKGFTHFSNLFKTSEVYPLENFRRDIRRLSQVCDVVRFFLLGGEPLLVKNLDEYMKISRQYLPHADLNIVTNGLLIPSLPQKILDAVRENKFLVNISDYPPTDKVLNKIKDILNANKIYYKIRPRNEGKKFNVFMTLGAGNDPTKSRVGCSNAGCRFLRNGKIYKCPVDALSYKFAERFGLTNYPKATGVDLYAPNFSALLPLLDENVELCYWCSENVRKIPWEISNNPKLEDWLADPEEIKNFR